MQLAFDELICFTVSIVCGPATGNIASAPLCNNALTKGFPSPIEKELLNHESLEPKLITLTSCSSGFVQLFAWAIA
jgi:hypothetical protein